MKTMQDLSDQALIFIPDISGFTQFVNNTEINHAKHITEELLEVLIDSNDIGLQLSEIEGDALLFYRNGKAPTAAELLAQVQKMYVNFHGHLKKYETSRICSCGACLNANELRLKFVAHYGEVAEKHVKDRSKLFGKDVIVSHRLLKNEVKSEEYILVSKNLMNACSTWLHLKEIAWSPVTEQKEKLDTGPIEYCFVELEALSEHIPEPTLEDYSIHGATQKLLETEGLIEAPIDLAFDVLSDLSLRHEFTVGLIGSDMLSDKLTRNGSTHRCVIQENEKDPLFVSHDFQFKKNKITFVESNHRDQFVSVWTLTAISKGLTRVSLAYFAKPNLMKALFYKFFFKKKHDKANQQSFVNFNAYCKKLLVENQEPQGRIVLPESVVRVV